MILPRLFNHGILRSIKKENGKLVLEGTTGKEEFEGGSLPDIGESDAGKVLMVDGGEAKWLWQLPPGSAGQFLKRTGTGQNFAFSNIREVPAEGNNQDVLTKTASGYMWAPPSGGGAGSQVITAEIHFSDLGEIEQKAYLVNLDSLNLSSLNITSLLGTPSEGTVVEICETYIDGGYEGSLMSYYFDGTGIWKTVNGILQVVFPVTLYFDDNTGYTGRLTIKYSNGTYIFDTLELHLIFPTPEG